MRHPLGPEQSTLDEVGRQFTATSKVARHDRQGWSSTSRGSRPWTTSAR